MFVDTDYTVELIRQNGQELGLVISQLVNQDGTNGLIVSDISKTSPAAGKIRVGDIILEVNGVCLRQMKYADAVYRIKTAGEVVRLGLSRSMNKKQIWQNSFTSLPALGKQNRALGVNARTKKVYAQSMDNLGGLGVELVSRIFVKSVDEGGLGEKFGLREGDRLVSLNGISAAHLSLVDTANMLRRQHPVLTVARDSESSDLQANSWCTVGDYPVHVPQHAPLITDGKSWSRRFRSPRLKCESSGDVSSRQKNGDVHFSSFRDFDSRVSVSADERPQRRSVHEMPRFPPSESDSDMRSIFVSDPNLFQLQSQPGHLHEAAELWASDSSDGRSTYCPSTDTLERNYVEKELPDDISKTHIKPIKKRQVLFRVDPNRGTGLSLVGGNLSGVFIADVQPDSLADQAGISKGDKITKINNMSLKGWTKEEVALALIADDEPAVLELIHKPEICVRLEQVALPCESFQVRAYFDYTPDRGIFNPTTSVTSKQMPELDIAEGDIFNVTDTFVDGVFGNWVASKVYPAAGHLGVIPNVQRAESYVRKFHSRILNQRGPTRQRLLVPPYEKVIKLNYYPFPRPVVIYGPLSALARYRLKQVAPEILIPKGDQGSDADIIKFVLPPVNATGAQKEGSNGPAGLIRVSAIKADMQQGYHSLLDINPMAVQRLILLGIPPIVILIIPSSKQQLKKLLRYYWNLDRKSPALTHPTQVVQSRDNIKDLVGQMWKEITALREYKAHIITDSVPLIASSSGNITFSEIEWLRNLVAVIKHQQQMPVWVGEETQIAHEVVRLGRKQNEDRENIYFTTHQELSPFAKEQDEQDATCAKAVSTENGHLHKLFSEVEVTAPNCARTGILSSPSFSERTQALSDALVNYRLLSSKLARYSMLQSRIAEPDNESSSPSSRRNCISEIKGSSPNASNGNVNGSPPNQIQTNGRAGENGDHYTTPDHPVNSALSRICNAPIMDMTLPLTMDALGVCLRAAAIFMGEGGSTPTEGSNQFIDEDFLCGRTEINGERNVETMHPTDKFLQSPTLLPVFADQMGTMSATMRDSLSLKSLQIPSSKQILAECAGEFGSEGGMLELPEYQVRLRIPVSALPSEGRKQKLFLRIYDCSGDECKWSTNVSLHLKRVLSPMVMCGPKGLRFKTPVELSVPQYHFESDSNEDSDEPNENGHKASEVKLLCASAMSTSTSADEESLQNMGRKKPPQWQEVPMRQTDVAHAGGSSDGLASFPKESRISILIDHF
ncbi:unnamed protein product [Calicophoron daubneyi]|uniref:Tight junction protein ZO-3 n=1 Tax=Calicophoron daubneyi TaxID=300641 RepID=A0AAV2T5X4_CALDB